MHPGQAFGLVLRELRKQREMSQETFAFECSLNRQFISLLELGEQAPSIDTIYKVAAGFGMRGSELLSLVEVKMQALTRQPLRRTARIRRRAE